MTALSYRILHNAVFGLLLTRLLPASGHEFTANFDIESGAAAFEVATNVPGVEVRGKSASLAGRLSIKRDERGLTLQGIDVKLPVKSLTTGMRLRDEHMRKLIFTSEDAQTPDIRFTAETVVCPGGGAAQESSCQVSGSLSIRGQARPFAMSLNVREQQGATLGFHAAGDAVVRLSDYGIRAPSQFGVTASNDVKLHLDFSTREKPASLPTVGGPQ